MTLWQDIRYGCRMLAASPGFAVVSILSLAIGIGANCAIFSFADALLLRPLPVARPGEVLTVGSRSSFEALNASSLVSSYRDYVDIRDRNHSFDGLAAFSYLTVGFAADPSATPKIKMGMRVSGNLLPLMGVEPTIGRAFRPEEDQVPGRDAVVILGHICGSRNSRRIPVVLGGGVRINGAQFTVIGVAPATFTGMSQYVRADFFVPMMMSPRSSAARRLDRSRRATRKPHVEGAARGPAPRRSRRRPSDGDRSRPRARVSGDEQESRSLRAHGAAGADRPEPAGRDVDRDAVDARDRRAARGVRQRAGLLTSRAPMRAREMALRLAIGAGRGRLVRQLITESLLVAIAGGVLGLGIGYAGMMLFRQIEIPTELPILLAFQMDRRALPFSLAVAVVSAVIFGIVPAIQASRTDMIAVMKAGDIGEPGRRRRWGRAVLVGRQVAVSVVLLAVAMFIYRGFGEQLAAVPAIAPISC